MSSRDFVTFSDGRNELVGSWHHAEREGGTPLVILATGDGPNGSEGLTWQNLVPMLLSAGLSAFLFDFSGLGHSKGNRADLTLSLGIDNFDGVMQYVQRSEYSRQPLGVIGASYGANVALLRAWEFPQIRAIGLKSPCCILAEAYELEYGPEHVRAWGESGYSDQAEMKYGALLDSLLHNTYAEARKTQAATRIVHGTSDSAVPVRQARDLARIMLNVSLLEIEGADHWYAEGDQWERMAKDLVSFMSETLIAK